MGTKTSTGYYAFHVFTAIRTRSGRVKKIKYKKKRKKTKKKGLAS
jgi:hypothetical protein